MTEVQYLLEFFVGKNIQEQLDEAHKNFKIFGKVF